MKVDRVLANQSLGAVIAIFSGLIFNGEKIVGSKKLLPSLSSTLSLYQGNIGSGITFLSFAIFSFNHYMPVHSFYLSISFTYSS